NGLSFGHNGGRRLLGGDDAGRVARRPGKLDIHDVGSQRLIPEVDLAIYFQLGPGQVALADREERLAGHLAAELAHARLAGFELPAHGDHGLVLLLNLAAAYHGAYQVHVEDFSAGAAAEPNRDLGWP